jgi:hypothetical protein
VTAGPAVRGMAYATSGRSTASSSRTVVMIGPDRRREPAPCRAAKRRRPRTRPTREEEVGDTAPTGAASGRQTVAALVAPGPEDRPPGTGGHPMPEAVALRSLAVVGLIRALHCVLFCGAEGGASPGWRSLARSRRADRARAVSRPVRVEENPTTRQSAPASQNLRRSLAPQANWQVAGPWKPVDRVLRCPGHGRSGGWRRKLHRRIALFACHHPSWHDRDEADVKPHRDP